MGFILKNLSKQAYAVFDNNDYDEFAFSLNVLHKQLQAAKDKIDDTKSSLEQFQKRINLYMNEFVPDYDCKKLSILFINQTDIEIYFEKDISIALKRQKTAVYDNYARNSFSEEKIQETNNEINELQKFLPEPEYKITITKKQMEFLHKFLNKYNYIVDDLEDLQRIYNEIKDDYLEMATDCLSYILDNNNDYDTDEQSIMIVKNEDDIYKVAVCFKNGPEYLTTNYKETFLLA